MNFFGMLLLSLYSHQPASSFTAINNNTTSNKFTFDAVDPSVVMSLPKNLM